MFKITRQLGTKPKPCKCLCCDVYKDPMYGIIGEYRIFYDNIQTSILTIFYVFFLWIFLAGFFSDFLNLFFFFLFFFFGIFPFLL